MFLGRGNRIDFTGSLRWVGKGMGNTKTDALNSIPGFHMVKGVN